jgi:flap endonuclease-1
VPAWRQSGNQEDVEKYSKRTVRVTREHNEECKRLLRLMGVPVLEAPTEAEAQCAQLCKDGLVSVLVCVGWGGVECVVRLCVKMGI